MNSQHSRRSFIEKLALAAASIGLSGALGRSAKADTPAAQSPLLDSRFDVTLGEEYFEMYPEEVDLAVLVRDAFGVELSEVESLSQAEIHARLAEGIRKDFAEGKVIKFRGWRLSHAECRFFAIQTILQYAS